MVKENVMSLLDFSLFDDELFVLKHQIDDTSVLQAGEIIGLVYSSGQYLLSYQHIAETVYPKQASEVFLRTQRDSF